jgi:hypothetical protein
MSKKTEKERKKKEIISFNGNRISGFQLKEFTSQMYINVKQSRYRPGVAQRVPGS